jgi:DNA-binding CsgD family transcriptional regulator
LVGRERELEVLEGLLANAAEHGGALLLRGEPGVGRSVLLAAASERAEHLGMQPWWASGVRFEAGMPFAGLHQILRPLLGRAHGLSTAHREALLAALRTNNSGARDSVTIAVATLELLADVASQRPLLLAIDDAHWLDAETAGVLGFVARRLASEPVVLLLAARDDSETPLAGFKVHELHIEALDDDSAVTLLGRQAPALHPRVRARVLAEAAGNPLALVELASAPRSDRAVFGSPARLPTTARLDRAFVDQYMHLPSNTRAALLIASVDEQATLDEILAAAALMGDDASAGIDDLAPAVRAGLVRHGHTRVSFRHPLLPAVIYRNEPAARRGRAHAALATVLVNDPYRRTWHRAALITGPDDALATELEMAAFSAPTCWKPSVRVAALERAAELTADMSRRQRRLLRAAELALDLGQLDRTERLLGDVTPETCRPLELARGRLLRDLVEPNPVPDAEAVACLVGAALEASAGGETDVALRLLRAAALCSWWANPGPDLRDQIAAAAQQLGALDGEPRALAILAMTDPDAVGDAISHVDSQAAPTTCDAEAAFALGTALHMVGACGRSATYLAEAIAALRRQGVAWLLSEALTYQAWNAVAGGSWSVAAAVANEAVTLAGELGQPLWEAAAKTALAAICAIRGTPGAAEVLLAEAESIAVPRGASAVLADVEFVRAIIAAGAGRYEAAFEHLQRTFDPDDPAHHRIRSAWRIGELVEAARHAGRIDEVQDQLAACEARVRRGRSPHLEVGVTCALPLAADDDHAEALFKAALRADLAAWPLHRARLLLHYGTWLRRRRKVAQSRMPLRAARDALVALGATPWVDRARQELRASRETQHRGPGAWLELTEQELEIANMAAQGLTNREIGQRMYISPRTVGSHLYRIFPKLGIATRAQLAAVLSMT